MKRNTALQHNLTTNKHYLIEGGGIGDTMMLHLKKTNRVGDLSPRPYNGVTGHASYN